MADTANSDTIEVTREQASEALTEVSLLAGVLGRMPGDGSEVWSDSLKQDMEMRLAMDLYELAPDGHPIIQYVSDLNENPDDSLMRGQLLTYVQHMPEADVSLLASAMAERYSQTYRGQSATEENAANIKVLLEDRHDNYQVVAAVAEQVGPLNIEYAPEVTEMAVGASRHSIMRLAQGLGVEVDNPEKLESYDTVHAEVAERLAQALEGTSVEELASIWYQSQVESAQQSGVSADQVVPEAELLAYITTFEDNVSLVQTYAGQVQSTATIDQSVVADQNVVTEGTTTVEKPIVNGRSVEESADIMDKIQRIEQVGLAQIIPRLNELTVSDGDDGEFDVSPAQDIQLPSNLSDGVWDQQSVDAYQQTMQHLIYLTELNEMPKLNALAYLSAESAEANQLTKMTWATMKSAGAIEPQKTGHDVGAFLADDANVEKLKSLLEGSLKDALEENKKALETATGDEKARLEQERQEMLAASLQIPAIITDMKALNEMPSMVSDVQSLQGSGLLDKPFEMTSVSVAVEVEDQDLVADEGTGLSTDQNGNGADLNGPSQEELEAHERRLQEQAEADAAQGVDEAARLVKKLLQGAVKEMPEHFGGMVGGEGGAVGGITDVLGIDIGGLAGSMLDDFTLTDAEVASASFGEKENNILATALMAIKTLDGQEKANGVYDENAKATLQRMFLTHEMFAGVRDVIAEEAKIEIAAISTQEYSHYEKAQAAISTGFVGENPITEAQKQSYQKYIDDFEAKHEIALKAVGGLTDALDTLSTKGKIDNKKAAQKTAENVGGHYFMRALDSIGIGDFVRDIFDSPVGGMIKAFLGFIGIDVDFILGNTQERSTGAALEQKSIDYANTSFDEALEQAKADNPDGTFQEHMQAVIEDYDSKASGFGASLKNAVIGGFVGSDNVDAFNEAVNTALQEAAKADNEVDAKAAFSASLQESAASFRQQPHLASFEEVSSYTYAVNDYDSDALDRARTIYNASQPQVEPDGVSIGDNTYADIKVQADTTVYEDQDPTRFANAEGVNRVEIIAQYLIDNGELHGLDAEQISALKDADGSAVDVMTPEFNVAIQQLFVDAKVDEFLQEGDKTKEELQAFVESLPEFEPFNDGKPTEHMDALSAYMKAQDGVDTAAFDSQFYAQIESLALDFGSAADGEHQNDSVWEQSFTVGGFAIDFEQYQPPQDVDPNDVDLGDRSYDAIRKAYLDAQPKDSPCEYAVFALDEETGDVSILIRDKNRDEGEDLYRELTLENFVENGEMPDEVVKELIENYYWSIEDIQKDSDKSPQQLLDEQRESILAYMERCLGIVHKPVECLQDANECRVPEGFEPISEPMEVAKPIYVSEQVRYNDRANEWRDQIVPDDFQDLRLLCVEDANDIMAALEDSYEYLPTRFEEGRANASNNVDRPTLYPGGTTDPGANFDAGYLRMEDMFLAQMQGSGAGYMIMDLEKVGVKHPDVDAIVAFKSGNSIDFHFVNYEEDRIVPLSEQAEKGPRFTTADTSDFENGRRTLDTVLVYHNFDRLESKYEQGPATGYRGNMVMIAPTDDNSTTIGPQRAAQSLFGSDGMEAYRKAHMSVWNDRAAYLVERATDGWITRDVPENAPSQKSAYMQSFADQADSASDISGQIAQNQNDVGTVIASEAAANDDLSLTGGTLNMANGKYS